MTSGKQEKLEHQEKLERMAVEMSCPLFSRLDEKQAAAFLGLSVATLQRRRSAKKLGFIPITERRVQYFGAHLLEYLLNLEQPAGGFIDEPKEHSQPSKTSRPNPKDVLASAKRTLSTS